MRWWCREGNFDYGTNLDDKKVFFCLIAASINNNKNITNNSWIAKVERESISLCSICLMFLFLSLLISLKLCTQTVLFVSSSIVIFSVMMNWRYVVNFWSVLRMNFRDFCGKLFDKFLKICVVPLVWDWDLLIFIQECSMLFQTKFKFLLLILNYFHENLIYFDVLRLSSPGYWGIYFKDLNTPS